MILPALSRARLAGAAASAAALITATVALVPAREPARAAVTVAMPKPKPVNLIQATSGTAATEMRAVGDEAKLINAALPFASAPLRAAQSFFIRGASTDEQRALLCLTQAVYYEAGYEPLEGRRAVAQVVLNRMRHPAFPKSICGVVYQGAGTGTCQFTFVCDGALYRRPAPDAWRQAEDVARQALAGYVEKAVGEATHYHADYVAPRWAPMLAKVAVIGQHIFYRWPGAWGQPAAFSGRYIGEPRDPMTMRPAAPDLNAEMASAGVAVAQLGPPVRRADDDVGGLLDPTKGWTLHIPGPDESGAAAASIVASQQSVASATSEVAATVAAGPITGSR